MNYYKQRQDILDNAEVVDEETYQQHIGAFISNFVVKEKRHRWRYVLIDRREKGGHVAGKMISDLARGLYSKIEDQAILTSHKAKGVYFDFSGEGKWLSMEEGFFVGHGYDSIFSLEKGTLAIYFWHELEEYLCKK